MSRPANTEKNIGSAAKQATSEPTVKADAPSSRAKSEVVIRQPT